MPARFRNDGQSTGHRVSTLLLLAGLGMALPCAAADVERTDDFLAITFEAESADARNDRWVLTTPETPTQEDDPDGNHSDQAVGQTYLELLPDTRVTDEDELIYTSDDPSELNYWDWPGAGPRAEYPIEIPEPGRYYVHLRVFSTGTEDNGIHVGLDGAFPASGARSQFCIAGAGWQWRYHQRDSGGQSCGVSGTIYLDIEEAGSHTFMVSAREDGFELDRIVLLKDLSENTRVCEPKGEGAVQCRDGRYDFADEKLDLHLNLEADVESAMVGENVNVTVGVRNLDNFDTGTGGSLSIVIDDAFRLDTDVEALDETCTTTDQQIDCAFGELKPQSGTEPLVLALTAIESGLLSVDASIIPDDTDDNSTNNESQLLLDVTAPVMQTSLGVSLAAAATTAGEDAAIAVSVTNDGAAMAQAVNVTVSRPGGVSMTAPAECVVMSGAVCELGDLDVGESRVLNLSLLSPPVGTYVIDAALSADNDSTPSDNTSSVTLQVALPEPEPEPTPDPDDVPDAPDAGDETDDGVTAPDTSSDADDDNDGDDSDGGAMGLSLTLLLTGVALRRRRRSILRH